MRKTIITSTILLSTASIVGAQDKRPNIVLFLIDDMGVMDSSVPFLTDGNGDPVRYDLNNLYRTPNMEKMAEAGIRFSHFYAQSTSSPSRSSIMTGQNATRHRTTNWINSESNNRTPFGPNDWNWLGIKKGDITLPLLLKEGGYKTIHVGKAHFGPIGSFSEFPQNIGFDINIAGSSIGQPGSYYAEEHYGHTGGWKARAVDGLEKYHGTSTFLTEALTLEANIAIENAVKEGKPFFLNFAHYAVHAPFHMDKRFEKNYAHLNLPNGAKEYATLIEGIDKSLGDLIVKLNELGIAENTLIIFLGDNGSDAPLGEMNGYASSAPLRGKKGTIYEGGVRIPFIASWAKPNRSNKLQKDFPIKSGATQLQSGTVMDIFPTILDLCDVDNPNNHKIDGVSLKRQFANKQNRKRPKGILMHFPHQHNGSYFTTYIEGDYKLIYFYNPANPESNRCELYNLKTDPFEKTDLSANQKELCNTLIDKMSAQLIAEEALYPQTKEGKVVMPRWVE